MIDWPRLIEGDRETLAAEVERLTGIHADPARLMMACRERLEFMTDRFGHKPGRGWSECSWQCWIKLRLAEIGAMSPGHEELPEITLPTTLHVGFLSIRETPDELARLRNEPAPPSHAEIARSRIIHSLYQLHPIDRTAHRVAPQH